MDKPSGEGTLISSQPEVYFQKDRYASGGPLNEKSKKLFAPFREQRGGGIGCNSFLIHSRGTIGTNPNGGAQSVQTTKSHQELYILKSVVDDLACATQLVSGVSMVLRRSPRFCIDAWNRDLSFLSG